MGREPRSKEAVDSSASRERSDLSGRPDQVADELKKLVATLRENLGSVPGSPSSALGRLWVSGCLRRCSAR
jgi:hypothetical protein